MQFTLTERQYELPVVDCAERSMQAHYEAQGYHVLNNSFWVLYDVEKGKHPENRDLVHQLFDPGALKALDKFCRTIYSSFGVVGVAPGHPDLLVFRDDKSVVFFCEVKQGNQDTLSVGEMLGISLIHTFLGCRTEVARLNGRARTYRWVWPALQPLHPDRVIQL